MPRPLRVLGLAVTLLAATITASAASHAATARAASAAPATRTTSGGLSARESYVLRMEALYFGHGGYNAYAGGHLTLHALHGSYVLTYPVWNGRLSATYRKTQLYIVRLRLRYEMQLLAQETMDGGGSCIDPANDWPAICTGSGMVAVDRTSLALGSTL